MWFSAKLTGRRWRAREITQVCRLTSSMWHSLLTASASSLKAGLGIQCHQAVLAMLGVQKTKREAQVSSLKWHIPGKRWEEVQVSLPETQSVDSDLSTLPLYSLQKPAVTAAYQSPALHCQDWPLSHEVHLEVLFIPRVLSSRVAFFFFLFYLNSALLSWMGWLSLSFLIVFSISSLSELPPCPVHHQC